MRTPTVLAFGLCSFIISSTVALADSMNAIAERYAHLVLSLGQHDPDYVDAFYGPAEWKTQAEKEKKSLDAIGAEAAELLKELRVERTAAPLVESVKLRGNHAPLRSSNSGNSGDEMLKLRREY